MSSLTAAHVKHSYRLIVSLFLGGVLLVAGVTFAFGSSSATLTITPKLQPVNTSFSLVVGTNVDATAGIIGQVKTSSLSASVTAQASTTGTPVPAHAHGSIVIHNESGGNQTLSATTRLQSASGVIVRTANRVDVPAGGTVTVNVTADPTGETGNLEAGRLTIVALRPANQALIYGMVVTPLTGGTVDQSGTLALDDLTKASDQAQQKIRQQVGTDQPGHLRLLVPESVATDPEPTTPSAEYTVTVTMQVIDVTFKAEDMTTRIQSALAATLASDQTLVKTDPPAIGAGDQPTADSITLSVTAQALARITTKSDIVQPTHFVGQSRATILHTLTGSSAIKSATVSFSPFWRQSAPSQAKNIHIVILGQ